MKKVGSAVQQIQVYTANENEIKKDLKIFDIDSFARVVDMWSFLASLLFIIIFNVSYWTMAQRVDPELTSLTLIS